MSYEKFESSGVFGVISANVARGIEFLPHLRKAGCALTAALEEVILWDISTSEYVERFYDVKNTSQVCALAYDTNKTSQSRPDRFAAGYIDGSIRIWELGQRDPIHKFRAHNSAINYLNFGPDLLLSGSADTSVILWDLVSDQSVTKLIAHKNQVIFAHLCAQKNKKLLDWCITIGKDSVLKIWNLTAKHSTQSVLVGKNEPCAAALSSTRNWLAIAFEDQISFWSLDMTNKDQPQLSATMIGQIDRSVKDRPVSLAWDPTGQYLACHGNKHSSIEIWKVLSEKELRKKQARKMKRKKEKTDVSEEFKDRISLYSTIRTIGRPRGISFGSKNNGKESFRLLVSLATNSILLYNVYPPEKDEPFATSDINYEVELPGHRTDIRCMALSHDDKMVATGTNGSVKLWNLRTENCIRTFDSGDSLSLLFLADDKTVVAGTKKGTIEVFDGPTSSEVANFIAHNGPIWALEESPDGKSIFSASSDKLVKVWSVEYDEKNAVTLKNTRTLQLSDEVLSIKISPNGKLLSVALLDSIIKIFFVEDFKFFLSLYGHKLPVLSLDISSDSKLLVSCSADKNVKIWGLDFGDCHRSIFAHDDSILQVRFQPDTHNFFTASKDKLIKHWDGDKFQRIQQLKGHQGEIWAMKVSHRGDFVVSGSSDRSIRVWQRTEDLVFLEEEKEKEMDENYQNTLLAQLEDIRLDDNHMQIGEEIEATRASKQTAESLTSGEKIIEALELGSADLALLYAWEKEKRDTGNKKIARPQRNPLFIAMGDISAEQYVMDVMEKTPSSVLEDSLLILPFEQVLQTFTFLDIWIRMGRNLRFCCRILFFVIQIHHTQIIATKSLRGLLDSIRTNLRSGLQREKDIIGFNIAGLGYLQEELTETELENFTDTDLASGAKRSFSTIV